MLEQKPVRTKATGDTYSYLMEQGDSFGKGTAPGSDLDSAAAHKDHSKIMSW
jgi:hypothetical protein